MAEAGQRYAGAPPHQGFSTRLINQPYVATLDALYEKATQVLGPYSQAVHDLASETYGRAVVPPLKGKVRAGVKAQYKYRDASGDGVAWYRLTDLVRATIEYADIDTMYLDAWTQLDLAEPSSDRCTHPHGR